MSLAMAENDGAFTRASITSVSVATLSSAGESAAFSIGESARDLLLANVDDVVRRMRITMCDGDKIPAICQRWRNLLTMRKKKSFLAFSRRFVWRFEDF